MPKEPRRQRASTRRRSRRHRPLHRALQFLLRAMPSSPQRLPTSVQLHTALIQSTASQLVILPPTPFPSIIYQPLRPRITAWSQAKPWQPMPSTRLHGPPALTALMAMKMRFPSTWTLSRTLPTTGSSESLVRTRHSPTCFSKLHQVSTVPSLEVSLDEIHPDESQY